MKRLIIGLIVAAVVVLGLFMGASQEASVGDLAPLVAETTQMPEIAPTDPSEDACEAARAKGLWCVYDGSK